VLAGVDNMGGSAANRLTTGGSGIAGTTLGATGGAETETLTLAQLPTSITSGNAAQAISVISTVAGILSGSSFQEFAGGTVNSIQNGSIGTVTSTGNN
jgi:microcystin-dependent protein